MSSIPLRPGLAEALAILQSIVMIDAGVGADNPESPTFIIRLQFDRQRLRDLGAEHWAMGPTPRYWIETLQELLQDLSRIYSNEARWSAQATVGATVTDYLNFLRFQREKLHQGPKTPANLMEEKLILKTMIYLEELEERRTAGAFSNPHEARQSADSARWRWEDSKEHEEFLKKQRRNRDRMNAHADYADANSNQYSQGSQNFWDGVFTEWEKTRESTFFGENYKRSQSPPKPSNERDTWYTTLGVSVRATKKQIIAAYRALAKQHHPDRKGGSHEMMSKLNTARDEGLAGALE